MNRNHLPPHVIEQLDILERITTYEQAIQTIDIFIENARNMPSIRIPEANMKNRYLQTCWLLSFYQKAANNPTNRMPTVTQALVDLFKTWLPEIRQRESKP